jgi:hypothetical protein
LIHVSSYHHGSISSSFFESHSVLEPYSCLIYPTRCKSSLRGSSARWTMVPKARQIFRLETVIFSSMVKDCCTWFISKIVYCVPSHHICWLWREVSTCTAVLNHQIDGMFGSEEWNEVFAGVLEHLYNAGVFLNAVLGVETPGNSNGWNRNRSHRIITFQVIDRYSTP